MLKLCTAILTIAGLMMASSARADEENVPLDKLPAKVKDAVKAKFPEAEFVKASKEVEEGVVLYEVGIRNKGQTIEVTTTEDGKIVEIESTIDARTLPPVVTNALLSRFGSLRFLKAEDIVKGDKTYFEVLIEHANGARRTEVQIDKAGKILHEEDKTSEREGVVYAPQRRFQIFGRSSGGCCCLFSCLRR